MRATGIEGNRTPRQAGYTMPGEWETHTRCWMAWPDREDLWGASLEDTQTSYAAVARAIRRFEPVTMVANPCSETRARQICGPQIGVLAVAIDDAWARDIGPSFLKHQNGALAGSAWRFNAWGGKSPRYRADAQFAERVLSDTGAAVYHSSLCVEGGAIHVDGEGTIVTTESVVLNRNRNPGLTKIEAERELCEALGAQKVIWLPGDPDGITGDMTDGHIDGLVSFVRPGVVIFESDPSAEGEHKALLKENLRALRTTKDAKNRPLEIIPLHDAYEVETYHELFCRSYVNFYIANGGIVMPCYGVPGDDKARDVLSQAFPDRDVVQVDVNLIAPGGGGIHCITQQQPV